jgi:carboxyl-terminal processing protease
MTRAGHEPSPVIRRKEKTMSHRSLAALLLLAWLAAPALSVGADTVAEEQPLTDQQRQLNLDSFDHVWTTIRDKHFDPELAGLDWRAVRAELRPRVEQASVVSEARQAMEEMIARLGQSHFAIIPAQLYETLDRPEGNGVWDGWTGIEARVIDGRALITAVHEGTPADEAGIRPGWVVLRIEDEELKPKIDAISEELEGQVWKDAVMAGALTWRLTGAVGDTVALRLLDGRDKTVERTLTLAEQPGQKQQIGYLPPLHVWIDVKRLDESIGYVAFNMFLDPVNVMPAFNAAVQSFLDADGLIIDIRGNGGGLPGMAMGMAGWLIAEKNQKLGTMYLRDNELKIIVNPRPTTFSGPVAVLVDCLSGSASEIFSGGLKDLGRAQIVGSRTTGAVLPSVVEKLPNGDGFQYAIAGYVSEGGEVLEGRGVTPDIEIVPTREALLEGHDPVLEAAIAWIHEQRSAATGAALHP